MTWREFWKEVWDIAEECVFPGRRARRAMYDMLLREYERDVRSNSPDRT